MRSTDPGTDTVTSYIVHWGDGNSNTYATDGIKGHTYADGPNTYSITVDLIDEDGTFLDRANALSVTVDNVKPTIAISGAASVNEGSVYSLTLGAVTDPGTDTVTSYIVHWGDGSSTPMAPPASRPTPTPTVPTPGPSPSTWSTRTAPTSTVPTRSAWACSTWRRPSPCRRPMT